MEKKITEREFLLNHWVTDYNSTGTNGWKYKGIFTTDIETAKKWYNAV